MRCSILERISAHTHCSNTYRMEKCTNSENNLGPKLAKHCLSLALLSLTLPEPERKTCNDGKLHYTTYLEKKDKCKEVPQGQAQTPALKGTEQQLACCDRTFRFRSQLDRHTAICHSTWHKRKPKSAAPKRKRGKKKPRRSRT